MYYVNARWLGGMLTNFRTMRTRIDRLAQLKKMEEDGTFAMLPKKEVIKHQGEIAKLEKYLGGVEGHEEAARARCSSWTRARSATPSPKPASCTSPSSRSLTPTAIRTRSIMSSPATTTPSAPSSLIASTMANAVVEGRQGEENTEAAPAEEAPAAE